MFVTNIFPPQLILQSNYTFSQNKTNFASLESKILSQINYLRINTKSYFNYYKIFFEEKLIENIMNNINKQNKKLMPLNTKKEISLAGKDYLNYLIENNIPKSYFEINKGNKAYFNLQQILSKYGQRKGKIFESVIINSISASEIVNKLIKDDKAIKMLLNPDMKYICITCGFVPQWKSECVIIDIVEDFIVYNDKDNYNNNGIQILNEIYLDENMAKIEEKYHTKTHKVNYEVVTRNNNKILEYNSNTTKENERFKRILPLYIQGVNPFYYKTKDGNFHKSFSFNKYQNLDKSEINKNDINIVNNQYKENKNNLKNPNLLLNINDKNDLIHPLNQIKNKLNLIKKNKDNNKKKEYKIITKNLNLKNIKINSSIDIEKEKEKKSINKDKNNEIKFDNNNNSFFTKENLITNNTKNDNNDQNEFNDNTFQAFDQINDISNVNQTKKQNSFFSLDTDISSILNPKKTESQEKNKFNFTPNEASQKNPEQKEENINGFCLNDKERFFKNNKREIKNMIKLYNKERIEQKKINNLRNDINNTEINDIKNTATFFYFNNKKEKKEKKVYQKRIPSLSNSYKKDFQTKSIFKGIKTKVYNIPDKLVKKPNTNNNDIAKKKEKKNTLSLVTDNNFTLNNDKKRIISFKANRRLYKNKSFQKVKNSNNDNKEQPSNTYKEPKYLVINPILTKNSNSINNNEIEMEKNDKYKLKKRHIEEIDIDLSNFNNSNSFINYSTNKYIYKKSLTKGRKINNNINTEMNGKYKITNIGNINNTVQNTIKNKYIIINTQIK